NAAVATPNHRPIFLSSMTPSRSLSAGRATWGKSPCSSPSNIQPSSAAVRAIHLPRPSPSRSPMLTAFVISHSGVTPGVGARLTDDERNRERDRTDLWLLPNPANASTVLLVS